MDVATPEKTDAPNDEATEIVHSKSQTRFKRRHMKRQWEELAVSKKVDGQTDEKKLCEKTSERIKRKKMAMLLGYCGVDYYGMQRNPGVRTIEEDLLKALLETKNITEEDFNNQQNVQFQRSSRTDKGVSAARQVVSLKLPLEINIDDVNKKLPECIRVFAVKRVTNKFNSKSKCNARTYSFTLPTYVFEPSLVSVDERKLYRIPAEKLEKVNSVLSVYKGTKSYHNFTEKKHFQDPSALRYMMNFSIDRVFVHTDMEFAVLLVKGQSFMLHQIRKMVGLMIAVVRGHTNMCTLERAFGKEKVMIPTAPGLGLVLDMVHYDRYDARYKTSHDSLTWEAEDEAVQKFKLDHIYPNIVKGEIEDNSIGNWLEKLNLHSYEPSDDVPSEKETEDKELDDDDDDDDDDGDDKETNGTQEIDDVSKSIENITNNKLISDEISTESKKVL
ncbi:pseudouridylate synthase 1 homolog isoform X2 [Achroia grisella]|nr:pseudouridylate synthase 1 homolog isoform X2 [Achroia grisella]XP_059051924.1 pseudouridylate synthase 1 homolog isoform X2 [Achroia grisella]